MSTSRLLLTLLGLESLLSPSLPGRGLPPPTLALRTRPKTQVVVDGHRWPVGRVLIVVHQHLAHGCQPVDHDHRRPGQLQAKHVSEAAPQLQVEGGGCWLSRVPVSWPQLWRTPGPSAPTQLAQGLHVVSQFYHILCDGGPHVGSDHPADFAKVTKIVREPR